MASLRNTDSQHYIYPLEHLHALLSSFLSNPPTASETPHYIPFTHKKFYGSPSITGYSARILFEVFCLDQSAPFRWFTSECSIPLPCQKLIWFSIKASKPNFKGSLKIPSKMSDTKIKLVLDLRLFRMCRLLLPIQEHLPLTAKTCSLTSPLPFPYQHPSFLPFIWSFLSSSQ